MSLDIVFEGAHVLPSVFVWWFVWQWGDLRRMFCLCCGLGINCSGAEVLVFRCTMDNL